MVQPYNVFNNVCDVIKPSCSGICQQKLTWGSFSKDQFVKKKYLVIDYVS